MPEFRNENSITNWPLQITDLTVYFIFNGKPTSQYHVLYLSAPGEGGITVSSI